MIEPMEPRRLLSGVSLRGGILTIHGTAGDDLLEITKQIEVDVDVNGTPHEVAHLSIKLNGNFEADFPVPGIRKVVVKLGDGNDTLLVGRKNIPFDIDGGDGNDTIEGGEKNDTIRGGAGIDSLYGGPGNDHFIIESSADFVSGGGGNDTADFSPFTTALHITLDDIANDAELGAGGNVEKNVETVIGGGGPDFIDASMVQTPVELIGGGGNDSLIGGIGEDTLRGGPGNDTLHGGAEADYLNGDGGRDHLFGDDGNDTLNGGGPDPIIPIPAPQPTDQDTTGGGTDGSVDTLNGGPGKDVAIVDPFDIEISIP